MMLMRWAWKRFDQVFFELSDHHPVQLAVYRIIIAGFLLTSNQLPSVRWIPNIPHEFRSPPPGLTSWLPHPTPAVALLVEISLVVALIGLLLGWRTRLMSVAVGVLGIVGSAMVFSFGKIDHTIFLWIVPLAMSSSDWGDRISLDSRGSAESDQMVSTSAVPFLSILLALAFLTAGLPKLAGGWLSTEVSATKSYFRDKVLRGETNISTSLLESIESRLIWESADWATLLLEFGFVFLILWPFGYRLLVNVAAVFHLIVLFVLNINFESSLALYLVFALQFIDVDRVERFLAALEERREMVLVAGSIALAAAVATQLAGPGLLRVALGLFGASDWTVALVTQLVFSAVLIMLTRRSLQAVELRHEPVVPIRIEHERPVVHYRRDHG